MDVGKAPLVRRPCLAHARQRHGHRSELIQQMIQEFHAACQILVDVVGVDPEPPRGAQFELHHADRPAAAGAAGVWIDVIGSV